MTCGVCGQPISLGHAERFHSFAYRRFWIEQQRRSETLIHELLELFPDLAGIHAPGCTRFDPRGGGDDSRPQT